VDGALTLAIAAMLGSALAHAGMSLLTKKAGDRLVFRATQMTIGTLVYLPWIILNPFPEWTVWRFLLASAATLVLFNLLMLSAFERGDMNLVYPIMRGLAPALAAIGALIFLGEGLSALQLLGMAVAVGALIGFAWPEHDGVPKLAGMAYAAAAAAMTASYTVIDAAGVRAASHVLTYVGWLFMLSLPPVALTAWLRRRNRLLALARREAGWAALAAVFGILTYTLAMFAYSIAPVAPMAALRETSIVFGAILGALVLKESFGLRRIALAILLVAGLVLIQTSHS